MEIEHIQSFYKSAGDNACYAFCIIKAGIKWLKMQKRYTSRFSSCENYLIAGIEKGWIDFNVKNYNSNDNFYVNNPEKFLEYLTGVSWRVSKESRDYIAKPKEIEIDFWAKTEADGKKGIGHFVCNGETNTLQDSLTVKNGFIYSKRIFRRQ